MGSLEIRQEEGNRQESREEDHLSRQENQGLQGSQERPEVHHRQLQPQDPPGMEVRLPALQVWQHRVQHPVWRRFRREHSFPT